MGWLDDKVVLAIGGASGIGRGAVEACAAEGARIAVLDRDPAAVGFVRERWGKAAGYVGDATDHRTVTAAVADTVAIHGRLDALLLFVGVFDYYQRLDEMDPVQLDAAFDELFNVNVRSQLVAIRAAAPALRSVRGSITLTLSTSSFYPGRGGALYVASKFALRGLVVQLGHELAPHVRVNGVAPGGTVNTGLAGLAALGTADRRLGDAPDRASELAARTPLGVALGPDDHAGAYVFLASDRARGVTGMIINSDGGMAVRG